MENKNAKEMARMAIHALEDKKAEDICVIDISEVSLRITSSSPAAPTGTRSRPCATMCRRPWAGPDIRRDRRKDIRRRTGFYWISAI